MAVLAGEAGNELVALPALRALAQGFAGRLTLVCGHRSRRRFYADLPLRKVVEVPVNDPTRWFAQGLLSALGGWDLLIGLAPGKSPLTGFLVEARPEADSIGLHPSVSHAIPQDDRTHSVALAFQVARSIFDTVRLEDFVSPPSLPPQALTTARNVRGALSARQRLFAVHADAGHEKQWPASRFRRTLDRLLANDQDLVVVIVGRKSLGIESDPPCDRIVPLLGLPITDSMAIVGVADAFLGIDSCFLHAADLFRTPAVGLFGPTRAGEPGIRLDGPYHRVEAPTMEAITVSEVIEAAADILSRDRTKPKLARKPPPKVPHRFVTERPQSPPNGQSPSVRLRKTWAVERLWRHAEGLPVESRLIDTFDIDTNCWWDPDEVPTLRSIIDHCRRIAKADLGFPVIVGAEGEVMDGKHRLARAVLEHRKHIDVVTFRRDPEPDQVAILCR